MIEGKKVGGKRFGMLEEGLVVVGGGGGGGGSCGEEEACNNASCAEISLRATLTFSKDLECS